MQNALTGHRYSLDLDSVLHFMGYADPAKARPKIRELAERELARANDWPGAWGCDVEVPLCGMDGNTVTLKQGEAQVVLHSVQLPNILRRANAVAILLVTAGQAVTLESRRLMAEGKMTQALAVSAVGSAMVVELMKTLTQQVAARAALKQCGTTLRVGPGYTGWHLQDQATLFSFYAGDELPVVLSHGLMMTPEKSLLGMVGLVPGGRQAPDIEPCRICDLKGCDLRKAPFRGYDGQGPVPANAVSATKHLKTGETS